MRGIFLSKKTLVAVICLVIALLTLKRSNRGLDDAEAMLISKLLENEYAVEVFGMDREGIFT